MGPDALLVMTVGAVALAAAPVAAAVDDTTLVSRVGLTGAPAEASSAFPGVDTATPSISGDGGRVAFVTQATNLGAGPGLYVKDMGTGTSTFLSPLVTAAAGGAALLRAGAAAPRLAVVSRRTGTVPAAVRVKLGEYGVLTLALERATVGRRVGSGRTARCVSAGGRPVRKPLRCTRYTRVATTSLAGFEGVDTFPMTRLVRTRRLPLGGYRLRAIEYDLGLKIGSSQLRFTVR